MNGIDEPPWPSEHREALRRCRAPAGARWAPGQATKGVRQTERLREFPDGTVANVGSPFAALGSHRSGMGPLIEGERPWQRAER